MAYKNKEKGRQNQKEYYQRNKEKISQSKKEYYQKNRETIRRRMKSYHKIWYQKNKRKRQQQIREYDQKNKEWRLQYSKKWYQKNKEKILQQSREYYQKNREAVQGRHKKYNQKNKERLVYWRRGWQRYKRKIDPKYRLDENMGSAISRALKNGKDRQTWETLVSYTLKDLMEHLEKQFDSKMNWNNYGSYWAVDHLKPRNLFIYTSPDDLEFKKCWALENLQPLEKIKNIKKGNHLLNF